MLNSRRGIIGSLTTLLLGSKFMPPMPTSAAHAPGSATSVDKPLLAAQIETAAPITKPAVDLPLATGAADAKSLLEPLTRDAQAWNALLARQAAPVSSPPHRCPWQRANGCYSASKIPSESASVWSRARRATLSRWRGTAVMTVRSAWPTVAASRRTTRASSSRGVDETTSSSSP